MQFYRKNCQLQSSNIKTCSRRTRQKILLHRRHSPTMSRAHLPTFPRVMRPDSALPWLSSRSTDLTLLGMTAPSLSISATVSMYSFSQRRVSRTSWCRKGARFTWNWRHVRDKAWRVFRSTARAISLTMLVESKVALAFCGDATAQDPRTDSNLRLRRKHCGWGSPLSGSCLERQRYSLCLDHCLRK